ncbi:MAG: transporter ATP-binding protein, partial [Rhodoferax sp.]|nr:transporter ATP-binding protein [Rhodoferax sp.]
MNAILKPRPDEKSVASHNDIALNAVNALTVDAITRHFAVSAGLLGGKLGAGKSVKAVDGVSFAIRRGQTFSLVGESGCGKSTLARMVAGLDKPSAGAIRFADAGQKDHRIQMIFQDPYASLNPRYRIGTAIAEPIRFQKLLPEAQVMPRVHELLRQVGLAPADALKFPHEFSGGQRHRVSIARALAGNPSFLVCDEPTSALDVSVQAQILNLLRRDRLHANIV